MQTVLTQEVQDIMNKRFGKDSLFALATAKNNVPFVRAVNAYYENGCFYIITHALSNKIQQMKENSICSLCGDWFTAQRVGENMGHILAEGNGEIASKLRSAFSEWYDNGHSDENDPNTVILRVRLTRGVLFSHGTRYDIDFTKTENVSRKNQ